MSRVSSALSSIGHSAAMKSTQSLTSSVHEMASNAGWPEEIIQKLSVVLKQGSLVVDYPKEAQQAINDLEYGTESEPPKMVIRRFNNLLPQLLQPHMAKEFEARIGEVVNSI